MTQLAEPSGAEDGVSSTTGVSCKKISKTQRMLNLQPPVVKSGAAAVDGTRAVFGVREVFGTSGAFG
jgi:hypothetical protein